MLSHSIISNRGEAEKIILLILHFMSTKRAVDSDSYFEIQGIEY